MSNEILPNLHCLKKMLIYGKFFIRINGQYIKCNYVRFYLFYCKINDSYSLTSVLSMLC